PSRPARRQSSPTWPPTNSERRPTPSTPCAPPSPPMRPKTPEEPNVAGSVSSYRTRSASWFWTPAIAQRDLLVGVRPLLRAPERLWWVPATHIEDEADGGVGAG